MVWNHLALAWVSSLALLAACAAGAPSQPDTPRSLIGPPPFTSPKLRPDGSLDAAIGDVSALPPVGGGMHAGYRDWLTKPSPRAFVIGKVAWSNRFGDMNAAEKALVTCRETATDCRVYARNNEVVWIPRRTDPVPAGVIPPPRDGADTWTYAGMLSGSRSTEAACRKNPNGVWVTVEGEGDCIVYFVAPGPTGPEAIGALYGDFLNGFHDDGDIIGWGLLGYRHPDMQAKRAMWLAGQTGHPVFLIGRPGTIGSSGDHKRKGEARESALIGAALDAISQQHGITSWALAGHSGGGSIVANLLAVRGDVACGVLGAAQLSMHQSRRRLGDPEQIIARLLDPMDTLAKVRPDPARRIIVAWDPRDRQVPVTEQRPWLEAARARGLPVLQLDVEALPDDPRHHDLGSKPLSIAAWCLDGLPDAELQARAVAKQWLNAPDELDEKRPVRIE